MKNNSTVALITTKKLLSGSPTLNWVGAEINILMDLLQIQNVVVYHLRGKLNAEAAYFSRPDMQGAPSGQLAFEKHTIKYAWILEATLPFAGHRAELVGTKSHCELSVRRHLAGRIIGLKNICCEIILINFICKRRLRNRRCPGYGACDRFHL